MSFLVIKERIRQTVKNIPARPVWVDSVKHAVHGFFRQDKQEIVLKKNYKRLLSGLIASSMLSILEMISS
jgi:hypothetical protein